MGHHLKDYTLTKDWVDLASLPDYTAIAGVQITVQAKFVKTTPSCLVFIGGTDAPDGDHGSLLTTTDAITSTNNHWWVKGEGTLAILVEE